MAVEGNMPTFKYVTVNNLVITYNGTPYPVKRFSTNRKYIIWNVDRPYQLEDSNVRPDDSLIEYLIVINDNGKPTIVSHDELVYSFDQLTNGGSSSSGEYKALKEQVNANTKKYNLVSETVDGMTRIIGATEELEDGTIIYNLNKVKADSESYGISISEIQTKIDDKYKELKPILLTNFVEYRKSVSEYKLSFTNLKEDIEITSEELQLINTSKSNMNNKLLSLQEGLDSLKAILDEINDTTKSQLITDAKIQLTTLNNALISLCDTALLNNKIDGNEKSDIIQKSYELVTYINTVQNTCNNITVNGMGGVIYSVENDFLIEKDKTTSNINELSRKDDDLYEKYSNIKQTTDSITEEVGELTNTVGDITLTSKKNVRSVVPYYCLSSSATELVGTNFANIQKGDLIFQGNKNNGRYKGVYHVAIYYGLDDKGVPRILECTGNNIVKLHSDNKTMGIVLSDWDKRKKSDIVCVARPQSSPTNRVFSEADEFVAFAKTYYDKRSQYFTYGNLNLTSDNFTRTWNETTVSGADSPDGLYRNLDCSSFLNVAMRGIPFDELFTNESVYTNRNMSKRNTYTWTHELPRYAAEQCEEVENLGWALSESEWHTDGEQWSVSVPENPNNYYIWSKNVTTYADGTHTDSEIACISNDQSVDGKSIIDITDYYYESTSATETTGGGWTTVSPRWSADKYVWNKKLFLYDDDSTSWSTAVCVSGTSPMDLKLEASTYVVPYDSFNVPKMTNNITLTATQTNFTDTINWYVSPSTVTLGGSGNTRTISPTSFGDIDNVTVTIQSKGLTTNVMIVKVKDGAKGQDGTSVRVLGEYNSLEELKAAHPTDNEIGDGYTVGLDLWIWNGTDFQNVGQFKGDPGKDGVNNYWHVKYSNDGGLTFTPNNGEDVGEYIGNCVTNEITDPNSVSAYTWIKFVGDKGDKGDTGNGVESIIIQYSKNTSTTVAPTTGWSASVPSYQKGYYLWYRTRTKYTDNPDYVYSTATCDTSWKSVSDILDIIGDWSSTETISESFSNVTKKVDSITQEVKRNSRVSQFRYIRDYVNGNTVNNGAHWVEIQVYKDNTNIAKDKGVTCSGTGVNLTRITDGSITSGYAEVTGGQISTTDDLNGYKYVQVDLGQIYTNIQKIKIWHYYNDERAYYHKLEVSKDGNEWFRFFDSDKNGLYQETVKGKTYIIDDSYSESQFEQTADKFSWIIKSGVSSSSMVFTDDFYSVITENIRLKAKNISLEGLVTANNKFKILADGSMESVNGKFSGDITAGTININNAFKVTSTGALTATKADISGKVTITDGSIDINNGLFKVLSNGNTKIGGDTGNTVEGYSRALLEITSNGNLFSVSPDSSKVYTKLSEGTIKVVNSSYTLTIDDAFASNKDAVLRSSLNSLTNGAGGSVWLCCNGGDIKTEDSRVMRYFKNSDGNYVLRSNSKAGVTYLGTTTYPWKEVIAKTLTQTSDRTLKENIVYLSNAISTYDLNNSITINDCYNFVANDLPVALYNYIDDDVQKIGFIAQDIIYNSDETDNKIGQLIVNPKSYSEEDGKLTYDMNNYVSVLAGALQVSIRKTKVLEEKIKMLEDVINGS